MMASSAPNDDSGAIKVGDDDATNTNKNKLLVPHEEAVAALSATLAFRRFDDRIQGGAGDGEAASSSNLARASSVDPMEDSLRRLSSILNGGFGASGNGHVRRESLETIISAGGSGSLKGSLRDSLPGSLNEFLGSQDGSSRSQSAAEILGLPSGPTKMDQIDDDSLDSEDLQELDGNDNEGDEYGGSMTLSQLEENKKLSCEKKLLPDGERPSGETDTEPDTDNEDRDDGETHGHNESVALLKSDENADHISSGRGGFVDSLQKLFDSSHNSSRGSRRRNKFVSKTYKPFSSSSKLLESSQNSMGVRRRSRLASKEKPLSSNDSSLNGSNSRGSSKERRRRSNESQKSYQNWKKRFISSSREGGLGISNDSHTINSSHDKDLSWRDKLEIKLEAKMNASGTNRNCHADNHNKGSHNDRRRGNRNQTGGINSYNNSHGATNNWKENSNISADLSSAWRHPPFSQTTSDADKQTIHNPPPAACNSKPTGKRAHVSWKVDDDIEAELGSLSLNSQPSQLTDSGMTNSGSHFASLTLSALGDLSLKSNGNAPPTSNMQQRRPGCATTAVVSVCEQGAPTESLAADELLLKSMIQLANDSGEMKDLAGKLNNSGSSWGIHHDASSASSLERSLNGLIPRMGIPEHRADRSAAAYAYAKDADEVAVQGESVDTRVAEGDENDDEQQRQPAAGKGEGTEKTSPVGPTNPTTDTIRRLASQEVEDYRARLQRKRASMANEGVYTSDNWGSAATTAPAFREESQRPNDLLFHNAANISTAMLLQRALYTLRIKNHNIGGSIRGGAARRRTMGGSNAPPSFDAYEGGTGNLRRSLSEHTGLDRMALTHLLSLSSADSDNANDGTPPSANADWADSNGSRAPSLESPSNSLPNRRRNTFRRTRQNSDPTRPFAPPQIGAIQSNEPAPLLYARTYSATNENRQARRAEARRNTLQMLERERQSSQAELSSSSNSEDDAYGTASATASLPTATSPMGSVNVSGGTVAGEMITPASVHSASTPLAGHGGPVNNSCRNNFSLAACRQGSNRSLRTNQSNSTDASTSAHHSIRNMLLASVSHQGHRTFDSARMLQAILVSDEIVEADHVETIHPNDPAAASGDVQTNIDGEGDGGDVVDVETGSTSSLIQFRLAAMEEMLEEQENEQRRLLQKYRRLEGIFAASMLLAGAIIAILIFVVIRRW